MVIKEKVAFGEFPLCGREREYTYSLIDVRPHARQMPFSTQYRNITVKGPRRNAAACDIDCVKKV